MKKWIVLGIVVAAIAGTWWFLRTSYRFTPLWYRPTFGFVSRGDIRVPITAAGLIEPKLRIEIKSKASGEVIEIPVKEGDFVHAGTVLLELKKTDEQRKYDAAKAERDRASALLEQAKVSVVEAKAAIDSAEADLARTDAQCKVSEFQLNKMKVSPDAYSEQEHVDVKAQHDIDQAQKKSAEARLVAAQADVPKAEEAVKLNQAAVAIAETQLGDAEERLDETTLKAKQDALVTEVKVKISEMIQSGTLSLMGGTVVMYLADVSQKKVVARVDESDYGRVLNIAPISALPETPGLRETAQRDTAGLERRTGKVKLTVDAFPEEDFEGVIERVEPQGKLNAGSAIIQYDVHVNITDPQTNKLPLGAQAQVEFTVESASNALRVPSEAVKSYQGQRGVWIRTPPEPGSNEQWGKKFVACQFGITDGEYTQVIKCLGDAELKEKQEIYTKLPRDVQDEK